MRIVTSGSAYIDIDGYAGAIAYAELLQAQGYKARAVSTAILNESICETVRSWQAPLHTGYKASKNDSYSLIDVSDPAYFDKIVALERVAEVIDHHPGYEELWQAQLGKDAQIEFIGAACTLVYERWKNAGLLSKMSVPSARLLICGILDNTLNFGAKVTTRRDVEAYDALCKQANLPKNWTAQYFTECQEAILQDVENAIKNDIKILSFKSFDQPICFGQLVVWDVGNVLNGHSKVLSKTLSNIKPDWFMNLICVGERKSYFVTSNSSVQAWLGKLLDVKFDGSIAIADRLWLRKEVIKQDLTTIK